MAYLFTKLYAKSTLHSFDACRFTNCGRENSQFFEDCDNNHLCILIRDFDNLHLGGSYGVKVSIGPHDFHHTIKRDFEGGNKLIELFEYRDILIRKVTIKKTVPFQDNMLMNERTE